MQNFVLRAAGGADLNRVRYESFLAQKQTPVAVPYASSWSSARRGIIKEIRKFIRASCAYFWPMKILECGRGFWIQPIILEKCVTSKPLVRVLHLFETR